MITIFSEDYVELSTNLSYIASNLSKKNKNMNLEEPNLKQVHFHPQAKTSKVISLLPIIVLVMIFLSGCQVHDPINDDQPSATHNNELHLLIFEDPEHNLSIDDIRLIPDSEWMQADPKEPNLGYTDAAFWVKIYPISSWKQQDRWYLEVVNPSLDQVDAYIPLANGTTEVIRSGKTYPFSERPLIDSNFIFPVSTLSVDDQSPIYLRVEASGSMSFPITLSTEKHFFSSNLLSELGWGIFFGIMGIMFLYHFLFYFFSKDRNHLYYSGFILGILLFQATDSGRAYQWLWPDQPEWNQKAPGFFAALILIAFISFTRSFLKLDPEHPVLQRGILGIFVISLSLPIASLLLPYSIFMPFLMYTGMAVFLVAIFFAIVRLRQGYRQAKIYLSSFTVLIVGTTVSMLRNLGYLPANFVTENGMKIGSVLLVIFLSFGIIDLLRIVQRENQKISEHRGLLESLIQMTNSITSTYELTTLSKNILPVTQQIIPAKQSFFFLKKGGKYQLKNHYGDYQPSCLSLLYQSIVENEQLIEQKTPFIFSPAKEPSSPVCDFPDTITVVPIALEHEVLGLILIITEEEQELPDFILEVLHSFARTAAIAIQNTYLFEAIKEKAHRDELTGLLNRHHFFELAEKELYRTTRYGHPLSVIMLDIDYFKEVNDRYGHLNGDEVLRILANRLRERFRKSDIIGRFGGEEFVVLLPETPLNDAIHVAEDIRRAVEEEPFKLKSGEEIKLTISIGITTYQETIKSIDQLIEVADQALYEAKRTGRNRVIPLLYPKKGDDTIHPEINRN